MKPILVLLLAWAAMLSTTRASFDFKVVCATKVNYEPAPTMVRITSADLLPDQPKVMKETLLPWSMLSSANNVAVGVALYPEEDGVPVVLDSLKVLDVLFTVETVSPAGEIVTYNGWKNQRLGLLFHENNNTTQGMFATASRTSRDPVSPNSASIDTTTIRNVGAFYLTKLNYGFVAPNNFLWRPTGPGYKYRISYKFVFNVGYKGGTFRHTITNDRAMLQVTVADEFPQMLSAVPPTERILSRGDGEVEPQEASPNDYAECAIATGKFLPLFKLEYADSLTGPWTLVNHNVDTVTPTSTASPPTCHCKWVFPDLPKVPSRFFRLRYMNGEVQYHVPQS